MFDSNLLFTLGSYQASITGNAGVSHPVSPFLSLTAITDYDAAGEYLSLILPVASLVGYSGGGTCSTNGTFCEYSANPFGGIVSSLSVKPNGDGYSRIPFLSGSLTPASGGDAGARNAWAAGNGRARGCGRCCGGARSSPPGVLGRCLHFETLHTVSGAPTSRV